MVVRAAWLYYAGGCTQTEVADKLGLTKLKAHRLITRANREGMVKFHIDGDVSECLRLEEQLSNRYKLDSCEVVPDFDAESLPLTALGMAGGRYLHRLLDGSKVSSIGIGHGRTLAACVEHIPLTRDAQVKFISLLGGFSKKFSANPHDVIHRLAQRSGAEAYVMPVPFVAKTVKDREVLLRQQGIKEVVDMAREAPLKVVGIGSLMQDSSLLESKMVAESEFVSAKSSGGVGEVLGHYFAADGSYVKTNVSKRTMGLSYKEIKESKIVAVAGGTNKSTAIEAVLNNGLLSGLITDERTARALV